MSRVEAAQAFVDVSFQLFEFRSSTPTFFFRTLPLEIILEYSVFNDGQPSNSCSRNLSM